MLLALCGPASSGAPRAELTELLGMDVEQASAVAEALLAAPHPLVASAAGVWRREDVASQPLSRWLSGLPARVETGTLTSQAALDDWADRSTLGLISEFPVEIDPTTLLVLATALATKISWAEPFDVAPASALGAHSPWASTLSRVLRTPQGWRHQQFIATVGQIGDVAVHTAQARDGLLVTSVAAQPGVPAVDVLACAYRLAGVIATGGQVQNRSLFTLPLGSAPLWEITEQYADTTAPDGREERCTALLPAWSAASTHKLSEHPNLGFGTAAGALAALIKQDPYVCEAKQAAAARYSRTGFDAAALTVTMVAAGGPPVPRPGLIRTAELRFGQPYAVVATATDQQHDGTWRSQRPSPWHGLPVFSAWITEPEDAS